MEEASGTAWAGDPEDEVLEEAAGDVDAWIAELPGGSRFRRPFAVLRDALKERARRWRENQD